MDQTVFYANCPQCGRIIEAVCPRIGSAPSRVVPRQSYDAHHYGHSSEQTTIGCEKCQISVIIYWYF